ncbi:MAG: rRNA maturation RNase YbeY [Eubacterium sp.]|nr:rRNA maturation RNase YbeY [Eubacterium sp.]
MNIVILNESDIEYPKEYDKIIEDVIEASIDYLKCPYECEVSVTLTDNDMIHDINLSERGIDKPTDVLSFPMVDFDAPNDLSYAEKYPQDYFNPETGELLLGDIVISLEKVASQAKEYGHSDKREIAFLVAHSCLHLFGYDHIDEADRVKMEGLQNEILNMKGYTRDYE